jgi:RNA polymerase sigma-54 factor
LREEVLMAMELIQTQKTEQRVIMTAQLKQGLQFLLMPITEISEAINTEITENPMLEADNQGDGMEQSIEDLEFSEPQTPIQTKEEAEFAEALGTTAEKINDETDWESYLDEYSSNPSPSLNRGSLENPEETKGFETYTAAKTSLADSLMTQWSNVAIDEKDYRRGEFLIWNLGDNGYLDGTLEELAEKANCSVKDLERSLKRVQTLDPPGIAARDLRECLLIQLEMLSLKETLAYVICKDHFDYLKKNDIQGLMKTLNIKENDIQTAFQILRTLNPSPGASYSTSDPIYVIPDVYIKKVGDDYVITLNDDGMPKLQFSKKYQELLRNKNIPDDTRKYLTDKLKGATFLIRSIHLRQKTIYRVTEFIFKFQRDFLEHGVEGLKPLVLKTVAEELGYHESTISRVTCNKYVDTPRGVFELKYFFTNTVKTFGNTDNMSSEAVRKRIKEIIEAENPENVLSDEDIKTILKGAGIDISRRTVAKYRKQLGVPSSSDRRKKSLMTLPLRQGRNGPKGRIE